MDERLRQLREWRKRRNSLRGIGQGTCVFELVFQPMKMRLGMKAERPAGGTSVIIDGSGAERPASSLPLQR